MERSIDSVLTLFPFEETAYSNSKIKTCYVGHPLSYKIDITNMEIESKVQNSIALLPGSRTSEILLMGDLMIKAAKKLKAYESKLPIFYAIIKFFPFRPF